MKLITIASILSVLFLLQGCNLITPPPDNIIRPAVPSDLLVRCKFIPELEEPATMGSLYRYKDDIMADYQECALRHDGLIEAVNKTK